MFTFFFYHKSPLQIQITIHQQISKNTKTERIPKTSQHCRQLSNFRLHGHTSDDVFSYFEGNVNVEKLRDLQHANIHDTLKTHRVPPHDNPTERSTPHSWRSTQKAAGESCVAVVSGSGGQREIRSSGSRERGIETHPAKATLGVAAAQYAQQLHKNQGNVHRACSREDPCR